MHKFLPMSPRDSCTLIHDGIECVEIVLLVKKANLKSYVYIWLFSWWVEVHLESQRLITESTLKV